MQQDIIIKTPDQIANIRESGRYLTELLTLLYRKAQVGVSLNQLEAYADHYIVSNNIKWAFKWYKWYPANLCLSVNDCVVHGIPDDYVLKAWDVLKIDCWIDYKGGISDAAVSLVVWWTAANPQGQKLIETTKYALDLGITMIWPGKKVYDYSMTAYNRIKQDWFTVIKTLTGHGVWVKVHEKPNIYNYAHPLMKDIELIPGMVIAIEPITATTSSDVYSKPGNDWNLYCKNGDIWAQREYTILITETWYEILAGVTEDLF